MASSMKFVFHSLDEQPVMRHHLDLFLREAAASLACRHGAVLVASELFTNAIEHGEADEVRIDADVEPDGGATVVLVVSHPSATGLAVPTRRSMPPSTSKRGRGLAIVNRLAVGVRTEIVSGWHRTEAILPLRG